MSSDQDLLLDSSRIKQQNMEQESQATCPSSNRFEALFLPCCPFNPFKPGSPWGPLGPSVHLPGRPFLPGGPGCPGSPVKENPRIYSRAKIQGPSIAIPAFSCNPAPPNWANMYYHLYVLYREHSLRRKEGTKVERLC